MAEAGLDADWRGRSQSPAFVRVTESSPPFSHWSHPTAHPTLIKAATATTTATSHEVRIIHGVFCMTTNDMFLRWTSSIPKGCCNAFRLSPCGSAVNSAYTLYPTALELPYHSSTLSKDKDNLTQHEKQPTTHTNEKLVGQSGRHYVIERVLQSKDVPSSHVYLTTCLINKLCRQHGHAC